jgi:hypothetical protein
VEEYDAVVSTIGGTPADPRADSEAGPPSVISSIAVLSIVSKISVTIK